MTDPTQNPGFSPDVYSAQYHGSPPSGVEYGSQHQKPGAGPRMGSQPMYNQQNPGQQHHPPHLRPNGPGIIPNQQNPPLAPSQMPSPINQPPSSATGPGQHYPQVPPQSSPNSMSGPRQVNGMTAYNQSPTQDNVASGAAHHMNGPHTAIPPRGPGVSQQPPAAFQQQMPGQQMQRQPLSYTQTLPQAQPSRPPISSSSTGMSASQPQGFPQQSRPQMASQPFPMGPSQTGPNMGQPQMQPPMGQPQPRPPMGQPQTRPPMGQSQTRPPLGQPQTRPPVGQPQTRPPMGQPQTRPPMGQPPTRPPIGPPQPRDAVGVQQVRPPLGPPQAQPTEGLSPSGVPPSNQPVGLPPASSPPGAVHAGGFSTLSSTPQPTGGRPEELPVPYHGQAQYSHQVHGHSSLTPAGLTPGSGPPSQRSSRAPSPIPGNSYDALEGQFSGSPQAPSPGDPSGAMQSNVTAPPPPTGGITGRRHYPQMAGGYAGNQYASPPPPQVSGAQVNTGYPGMAPSSTAQYPQQPDMSQPGQMANSTDPAQQGLNASFSSMKIKGDALRPVNLLQERHVIPPDGVEQVRATLPQEFKNVNCNPEIFRCTLNSLPNTQSLLSKSRLPLGILIHPFKDLAQLPVIQSSVIVRCRTCRTYINPFVVFVDMRRWKCNLCYRVNELPEEFNYDPVSKTYGEPQRRPEIRSSTIEFIAPSEYMLRPPQPAVYLYVIDVSFNAIESGYLQVFCQVLLEELERIPGDSRTQIGFITFDRSLHFYNLAEGLSQPQQLIVSDVDEIFLPCPDNLLVNMNESKELVIDLLNKLPDMFKKTSETGSALGPALQAAYKLMSPTGGRVSVFQTHLPTVGAGSLKCREDPNERAGKKVQHLSPATDFYKKLSLDCSAQQIAVDLFMLNSQYADLATVAGIAKYSGGCLHYFPNFHTVSNPSEVERLEATLKRYFTRKIGFESVMRIRCTRGLSIHTFHGNFFVRSTDLLSLPNINPDAGFGMQMSIDDNLECNSVCFQAALLYTSSKGERRIRVHTLCLPVTNAISEIYAGADQQAIVGLLSKMAVDKTMIQSIGDARDAMLNAATDMLGAYGTTLTNSQRVGQLPAPYSLRLLPLYILALMKSTGFRVGSSTKLDDRVFHLEMCKTAPLTTFMPTLYPHLYPVHALDDNNALSKGEQVVPQPGLLQLSSANMDRHGAYILDTGSQIILWLAAAVSDRFCQEVLNKSNFQAVPEVMLELPEVENPTSERLRTFIAHLQEQHAHQASFLILREDSRSRMEFLKHLIEDRTESAYSYYEFLQHLQKEVKS